jgi:hypothetical protein
MKRTLLLTFTLILLFTAGFILGAAETSSSITLIGSTSPEIQLQGRYTIKQPMLAGSGILTRDNNLKIDLMGKLSPVSINAAATATLTPLAVLEFSAGGQVGTGWSLPLLGGLYGIQVSDYPGLSPAVDTPLGGIYYMGKAGAAFQFDTGAVIPGDWSSVLVRVYQEINYRGYSGEEAGQIWDYEISGALVNGINYYAAYFLGYSIPFLHSTLIGVLLETDTYNLNGSVYDTTFYTLGAIANLSFSENFSVTLIPQWNTRDVDGNDGKESRYISERDLGWGRLAFQFTWSF